MRLVLKTSNNYRMNEQFIFLIYDASSGFALACEVSFGPKLIR